MQAFIFLAGPGVFLIHHLHQVFFEIYSLCILSKTAFLIPLLGAINSKMFSQFSQFSDLKTGSILSPSNLTSMAWLA